LDEAQIKQNRMGKNIMLPISIKDD